MNALTNKMPHLKALGLNFNPFPVVPDAHNYFMTDRMNCSISDILHCIDARKGFILISGEVGLGKTTLSRLLLFKLAQININTALVFNTFLQEKSLLKAINKDFNIYIVSDKIEDQLDALNRFLLNQYARNKNCVIVIDDAQQLSVKSLELIRQLSNLETNQNKLVQIILVAQEEILQTLNRKDLRQLKSRIALNIKIEPLSLSEVGQYVDFRLARAGASGQIRLEKKASIYLHKVTHGLPRQINLVLDRCLYVVAAYDKNVIDRNLVMQAFHEISINSEEKQRTFLKKTLPIYAIVILLGSLLGITIYKAPFLLNDNAEIIKTTVRDDPATINKSVIVKQEIQSKESKLSPQSIVYYPENQKQSLVKFLSSFNFGKSHESIFNAIEAHDLTKLTKITNSLASYKLLKTYIPQNNNQFWQILDEYQKEIWLTFWNPEITIEAFYQGYYSESIYQLQSRLSNEGYYLAAVDGIVGDKTLLSITALQTEYGIDASGFPNDLTLYILQNIHSKNILGEKSNKLNQLKNKTTNRYAFDDTKNITLNSDYE